MPKDNTPSKPSPFLRDLAVDLGTTTVRIAARGRGILLRAPSAALSQEGSLLWAGETSALQGQRDNRPIRRGVVADTAGAAALLKGLLRQAAPHLLGRPRLLVAVPSGLTPVERQAVHETCALAGVRRVTLLETPLAAALGAGKEVRSPRGVLVADIGSGVTSAGVVALGRVVAAISLPLAGDAFDLAIQREVRRKDGLLLGLSAAREAKETIGCLTPEGEGPTLAVSGRCLATGLPRTISLSPARAAQALRPVALEIAAALQTVLEATPPELAAHVAQEGLLLTGGGSLLPGLDALLAQATGLTVSRPPDPADGVIRGLEKALGEGENPRKKSRLAL